MPIIEKDLEAYIILMDPNPTILGGQKVIQTTDIGLFFFFFASTECIYTHKDTNTLI